MHGGQACTVVAVRYPSSGNKVAALPPCKADSAGSPGSSSSSSASSSGALPIHQQCQQPRCCTYPILSYPIRSHLSRRSLLYRRLWGGTGCSSSSSLGRYRSGSWAVQRAVHGFGTAGRDPHTWRLRQDGLIWGWCRTASQKHAQVETGERPGVGTICLSTAHTCLLLISRPAHK